MILYKRKVFFTR